MKGFLNQEQLDYIFFHLNHHFRLNSQLKESFVFLSSNEEVTNYQNKIIFILSDKEFIISDIQFIGEIPVLFPLANDPTVFYTHEGNIVFKHDFLKSVFYLLSGYQEYNSLAADKLGRFPYENSIQAKLGIISKPIVNYYFDFIILGLQEYCLTNKLSIERNKMFNNFAFFLTHDVDRVKYYDLNSLLYNTKILILRTRSFKKINELIKEILKIGVNILNIFSKKDPFWNFEFLAEQEHKLSIHSAYFFLPKDQKHVDSYYRINQKEIIRLIDYLKVKGHEIGLHGTSRSSTSFEALKNINQDFLAITKLSHVGIRQHRLLWKHPITAINQDALGFTYDTTLGFAAHEGFRNSYCHPFKLFDFENNRMLSYWEIPLTVMDSTLFYYRNLSIDEANKSIDSIIKEIANFNGVFTLLWHNSFFNEKEVPGITNFYLDLLARIMNKNAESIVGCDIVKRVG